MPSDEAVQRHLTYLLDQEKEERNERRGLEQRAGGLIAALLVGFPVAGTVAKNADFSDGAQAVGLILLGLALVGALVQAWRVSAALGAPKREPNTIRTARDGVLGALAEDRLSDAVTSQQTIVTTMRTDNGEMVRNVRRVTATLPVTLLGVLIALGLIVAGGAGGSAGPTGPRGHAGPRGPVGPRGAMGPRGRPGRPVVASRRAG